MIKYNFFINFLLIFEQIKFVKENNILEKYSLMNLNQTTKNISRTFLINDYCNIAQSKIIYQFFENIFEFLNSSNKHKDRCFILDNIFNDYYSQFDKIFEFNKESFIYFTCPVCHKDFKTNPLLNLHFKLYHMKLNDSLVCPGDFCLSINCNKYYEYFNIKKFSKEPGDVKFNRQPIEKDEKCSIELILFYKRNCMKLIEGCFGNNKEKYYMYYK